MSQFITTLHVVADCPQVQCVKAYVAQEPDELTLDESDVVNVFKKLDDGMYCSFCKHKTVKLFKPKLYIKYLSAFLP